MTIGWALVPAALSRWSHAQPVFTSVVVLGAAVWVFLALAAIRSCATRARRSRT